MTRFASLLACSLVLAPATAVAHIALTNPVVRTQDQKIGPCGAAGSVRGSNVTVLEPGAMIEVRWTEPINHPSHYRISFDLDGQDFTVPNAFMDFTQTENVLVDNIPDGGGPYSQMIQLPAEPCENCTLQLIQMMYDKAPYGDGNDIYFQCADIALRVGGGPGPDGGTGNPGNGDAGIGGDPDGTISGGCSTSGAAAHSSLILGLLGATGLAFARRRRRSA
jgi:MYXO-CTERM domain-containing protein